MDSAVCGISELGCHPKHRAADYQRYNCRQSSVRQAQNACTYNNRADNSDGNRQDVKYRADKACLIHFSLLLLRSARL